MSAVRVRPSCLYDQHVPYVDHVKQATYQREWLAERRSRAIQSLGGHCASCGAVDGLQLDHVDPATKHKTSGITSAVVWSWSWSRIQEELSKCQLLCDGCHKKKTLQAYRQNKYCKRGHDRTVVGTTPQGWCRMCRRENDRSRRSPTGAKIE